MAVKRIKLSIVIVYYEDYKALSKLLDSINNNKIKHVFELIVVNNNPDEIIKTKLLRNYKNIQYIESPGNIGYAAGNNLGVKHAGGEYLFILNPDTKIVSGKIDNLIKYLDENKNSAIIAPNLVNTQNTLFDKQGTRILTPLRGLFSLTILNKLLPNNKYYREYYMTDKPKNIFREVEVVPGTAFFIRKNIFNQLNGFDEHFFLFFEENDLCKRVKDMGLRIFMSPDLTLEHDWNPGEGDRKLNKIFQRSRFHYFNKHFGLLNALVVEFFANITKWEILATLSIITFTIIMIWINS
jgi:GT2 family glycosyltransferase